MIISRASSITINSKICVIPPVGMGRAGIAIKSKNKMAKLLSSNVAINLLSERFLSDLASFSSLWINKLFID